MDWALLGRNVSTLKVQLVYCIQGGGLLHIAEQGIICIVQINEEKVGVYGV